MVKVCHLTSVHMRYDIRIFQKQCVSLANNGYEVTLVVCDTEKDEKVNNVQILSTGMKETGRIKRMIKSPAAIYKIAKKVDADIYCFHDPELLFLGLKLKKQGKKVIFDSHEFYGIQIRYEKKYIPKVVRNIMAGIYQTIEHKIVKKLDAVLIPCTYKGKNVFENIAKRVEIIGNLPMLEELYCRYEQKEKYEVKKMCHVGSLTYIRGIYHLVSAMEQVDGILVLAGKFSPQEFEEQVKALEGFKKVDYRGYLNRTEVVELYNECDIGISTILNKGQNPYIDTLPTKVYEYMAMGLPVILSDYPYARKIVEKYKFGIVVNPESPSEIVGAINYLKEHPEQMKTMSENGRRAIKEQFNWKVEERKLIALYEELLCKI